MDADRKIYWGWYVVAGSFAILAANYGARYCFGIFVKPLALEHGWSRSVISLAAAINMLVYSVGSVYAGRILDYAAPRRILTVGALLSGLGFVLTGLIHSPLAFYLSYGLLVGAGASCMGVVVCSSSVGKWFVKKRGIAIGAATMGISFGTVALAPVAGFINATMGWRAGLIALGVIICLVGLIIGNALMGKTNPESCGLKPDGEKKPPDTISVPPKVSRVPTGVIFRDSRFWTIALGQGLTIMVIMSVFVHQVAYAMDRQIDPIAAAGSLAVISASGFFGQFFFGWLSDKVPDPKHAYFLGLFILLLGTILLWQADHVNFLYLSAAVYGFGYGCLAPILPILASDRFGRHVLGSIYGLLTFFVGLGGAIGPLLGGLIYDRFGSYQHLWEINIFILALMCIVALTLKKGKPFQTNL